jgi:hypothetical protein
MRVAILLLLLSTSLFAQMRGGARMGFGGGGFGGHIVSRGGPGGFVRPGFGGRPFSTISQGGRPFFPGARVTSLGPCRFSPCFGSGFGRFGRFGHFRHGFGRFGFGFSPFGFSPFLWGGGFGYPFFGDYDYSAEQQQPAPTTVVQQPALPQTLEVTIVDRRGEQQYSEQQNESESAPPARGKTRQRSRQPAIFVFKDGWRKELSNYAVTGGQLIDVTNGKVFRVPLDNIDWRKTFEANQKAGRKITLP